MALKPEQIVTLRPQPDDIKEAVRYAIKSGVHTYDRMKKDAWRRVARIARGKVNESMVRRYAESLGIVSAIQDKSYRQFDAFDFTFNIKGEKIEADVKTFHVLNQFIRAPRGAFTLDGLLSGVDHTSDQWHSFYPMLIPVDYKRHKDIYIFAVSVEDVPSKSAQSVLDYPWSAFPDQPGEDFMVNPDSIKAREKAGTNLSAVIGIPSALPGTGNAIYERNGEARQKIIQPSDTQELLIDCLSSFLAIQLDDEAHAYLKQHRATIRLSVQEGGNAAVDSDFLALRFREVFPRQDYALHLVGWMCRDEFAETAQTLPGGAPCYFYPPKQDASDVHQPGTKTNNRYVLPAALKSIATLTEL